MTSLVVYHNSIPNTKNQEKIDLLTNFSIGASLSTDTVIDNRTYTYQPSDVALIQGWVGPVATSSPHLLLRNQVITRQLSSNKYVIAVDSNLFLYANTANPCHYLRYSFNGIFPNTGIYCDTVPDPVRWQKISQSLNIQLKEYRNRGDHILVCVQRNAGWSMGEVDVYRWLIDTISTIRLYTKRPIVIRLHPGDKATRAFISPHNPACKIKFSKALRLSTHTDLVDDLHNCWAAVGYNSSPTVGAAIEGIPIFVCDPTKSQCREIANTDLSQIETPQLPDRQAWTERLAMFHWSFAELRSGECWQYMKTFASQ